MANFQDIPVSNAATGPINRTSLIERKILFARIGKLDSLPMPSYSLLELSAILKNTPTDSVAIANCIGHDHVLLSIFLRMFYASFPGMPAFPLQNAVEMVLPEQIRSLLTVPRLLDAFGPTEEMEWNHSYSCCILMKSILEDNEIENPDLVIAAHLHDIGKNVIRDWSPKKYKLVENHVTASGSIPFYKLENAVLQTNHAEAGAELLRCWGFPELIWYSILNHHEDMVPEKYPFEIALLQFVNYVDCKARGIACDPPSKRLMTAAGIAEIDENGYIGSQRKLIEDLRARNEGSIRKNVMDEMVAAEQAVKEAIESIRNEETAQIMEQASKGVAEDIGMGVATVQPRMITEEEALAEEENLEDTSVGNPDFDPDSYKANSVPASMAKREEEILRKMGIIK